MLLSVNWKECTARTHKSTLAKPRTFTLARAPDIRRLNVDPERWKTLDTRETVGFDGDLGRMGDGGGGDEDMVCRVSASLVPGHLDLYYDTCTMHNVFQVLLLDNTLEMVPFVDDLFTYTITKSEWDTQFQDANDWELCGP